MDNVVLKIIGSQQDIYGKETTIETKALGRYFLKNGVHYITYIDTELNQNGAETTTLLKVYPDRVILVRKGSVQQRQEFKLGQKMDSVYITPYGRMNLTVYARKIKTDFTAASGAIDIAYDLEVDGQWQSNNMLAITIQEGHNLGH